MHTQVRVHGTQWLLFIVHSFMWRASCLAWYSIVFQPTSLLPCHSLRDSSTTSPQLWLCNTLVSFKPKVKPLWTHFSLLASPADTPVLSSDWKILLLYMVMKSQCAAFRSCWELFECVLGNKTKKKTIWTILNDMRTNVWNTDTSNLYT